MERKRIRTYKELQEEKKRLELKLDLQRQIVKRDFNTVRTALKPVNVMYQLANNILPNPGMKNQLRTSAVHIGTMILLGRLTKNSSRKSFLRKLGEKALVVLAPAVIKMTIKTVKDIKNRKNLPSGKSLKYRTSGNEIVITERK
ncbi:MAG: hypothetical protein WD077_03105 [Bacteroidia bacterium]